MKKRYLMGMLIVLMFCLSAVSASEDASVFNHTLEVDEGYFQTDDNVFGDCQADGYVSAQSGDMDAESESDDSGVVSDAGDFAAQYGKGTFQSKLLNDKEKAIDEAKISYDGDGVDAHKLSLNEETSTIDISNGNDTLTKDVTVTSPPQAKAYKASAKDISTVYGTKAKYTVTVLDSSGAGINDKKVTITIGNNKYSSNTDSNGVATFTLNYNAGKYVIHYYVDDLTGSNSYSVKNKITFTILKWGLKGDVTKNKLIKKNIPNNVWVKKAVKATKKGLPLLKIQGGSGKVVFMTAGVHGNEISSQVAAMKMINYLTKHPIKGTVYFIPFVNVKAISKKVRETGQDFNRVAAKSGTISNKIVKMIAQYKCDAYGDFHTTKPGGAPGKNIVMGSKSPAKTCNKMTKYISKNCKVNKRIYKYAGQQYPGALADNVNKKGIPAVICEVVLPHNTITSKSVAISLNMMKHLLKFNSVI